MNIENNNNSSSNEGTEPKPITGYYSPFDDLAADYDTWFDGEGSLIFQNEVEALKKILFMLPKPWLEIGVGSGRFAQALGIETGLDPSIKLVEIAKSRGITALQGKGEEQIFREQSFGTVFLIVTLCFLDSPLNVLKEIKRILIPDGKMVIGMVLKESPWGILYQQKKEEGNRFYKHARFYSVKEIVRLLFKTGFLGEEMITTLYQKPGDVRYIEQPKGGYSADAGFTVIVGRKLD